MVEEALLYFILKTSHIDWALTASWQDMDTRYGQKGESRSAVCSAVGLGGVLRDLSSAEDKFQFSINFPMRLRGVKGFAE